MKIAIDVQSALGQKTGIGHYTAQLAAALKSAFPEIEPAGAVLGQGHDDAPTAGCAGSSWFSPALPGCPCRPAARARLRRAALKPVPVVLIVHDLIGVLFLHNLPLVSRFYWSWWPPHSVRWADRIIADSEHTCRDIVRLLGIPEAEIDVIYPGVDAALRPVSDPRLLGTIRQKYALPDGFILYLGTLEPRKGLDTLLAAFSLLSRITAARW